MALPAATFSKTRLVDGRGSTAPRCATGFNSTMKANSGTETRTLADSRWQAGTRLEAPVLASVAVHRSTEPLLCGSPMLLQLAQPARQWVHWDKSGSSQYVLSDADCLGCPWARRHRTGVTPDHAEGEGSVLHRLPIRPRSRHLPLASTEGSRTRNLIELGCGCGPDAP